MIKLETDFPILVCSCEKTKSIAKHMLISLDKYANKKIHIYIGIELNLHFDNLELEYIKTEKSDWKKETIFQINYIRKKSNSNYFLIILDDFIFNKKVDFNLIENLFQKMDYLKIKHLLLKPIDDSILLNIIGNFKKKYLFKNYFFKKIRKDHPYFSSLQIAIWDFEHFSNILKSSSSIWDFENQKSNNIDHNCLSIPIVHYKHVVEKGEWDFFSKEYCLEYISYFDQSNINFKKMNYFQFIFNYIKKHLLFPVFGYLFTKKSFDKLLH